VPLFHRPQVRRLCFLLWGVAWVVVAILMLTPINAPAPPGADLFAHVVLFGVMAFGAVTFCHHVGGLLLLALITVAAGSGLELAQGLVPYRSFDLLDMLADAIGAGFGCAAALIVLYLAIRPTAPVMQRPSSI
jgi:VanZ family protein